MASETTEKVEAFYEKYYKGTGIAPRHVAGLKEHLAKAVKKGLRMGPEARAFLKEKGVDVKANEVKEGSKAVGTAEDSKKSKKPDTTRHVELVPMKKPEQLEMKLEPSKLADKDVLWAAVEELRKAGVKVVAEKDASVDDLRLALHGSLAALSAKTPEGKLADLPGESVLKLLAANGCMGIFIDLRNADCAACPDQARCVRAYLFNSRDDFDAVFKKAGFEASGKNGEAKADKKVEKKAEEPPKKSVVKSAFKSDAVIFVFDEKNPEKPGTIEHAFAAAVLREGTMRIVELVPIWKKYRADGLPYETLGAAVEHLEEAGIGCRAENLPAEVKEGLSKAERAEYGIS